MKRRAVILLSGGLDSAVTLFYARDKGDDCHCLSFDYGQRHKRELSSARHLAHSAEAGHLILKLALPWKGSSLLDMTKPIPLGRSFKKILHSSVPNTYVPARNTVFLSMAASYAEAIKARTIYIGAHSEDSSGYPDCREEYLRAFRRVAKLGTKAGEEGHLKVEFPLIRKTKVDIIRLGIRLGVPFQYTWSCYRGTARPCMKCDSCVLRQRGFSEAGISDPVVR